MRRTIVVLGLLLLLAGSLIARPAALGSSAAQEPTRPPTPTSEPTRPPTPTKEPAPPTPTQKPTKETPPPTPTKDAPPTPSTTVTMTPTKEPAPPTPTPDCVPLTGIELSGPEVCFLGLGCLFTVVPYPVNATDPTYTWSTSGLAGGQGTTVATYHWFATGPQTVAVAAANCGGAGSADLTVVVEVPAAQLYLPVVLRE